MTASKAMWEVDPETRSKLSVTQKEPGNNVCCDCNAPSPQWASPKFGIFICLSCAGLHRGLGVHISFVRSISMDAFKAGEIERMRLGGNDRWRAFYNAHPDCRARGLVWNSAAIGPPSADLIAERYSGPAGDEYKDRLTCLVEGRDYHAPVSPRESLSVSAASATVSRSATPVSANTGNNSSPRVRVDDAYFARLGADNASRPADVPPNMGGKYSGFGSTSSAAKNDGVLSYESIQRDPVAALTKGLGWFTNTVSKTAKTVNDGYIQPTAAKIAELDLAKQAQNTAAQVARSAQLSARSAQEGFTRLVDSSHTDRNTGAGLLDENHKGFWDDLSSLADRSAHHDAKLPGASGGGALGTSAMGRATSSPAAAVAVAPGGLVGTSANLQSSQEGDEWSKHW